MRLLYTDTLDELKRLVDQAVAEKQRKVKCIQVTKSELRACLQHKDAASVFDVFMNTRQNRINTHRKQLEDISRKIAAVTKTEDCPIHLFNRQDDLESLIRDIKEEVPDKITLSNGIVIRVTLNV